MKLFESTINANSVCSTFRRLFAIASMKRISKTTCRCSVHRRTVDDGQSEICAYPLLWFDSIRGREIIIKKKTHTKQSSIVQRGADFHTSHSNGLGGFFVVLCWSVFGAENQFRKGFFVVVV